MGDISIQFHALPDELLAFVLQIVDDFSLRIVALQYRPFAAHELLESQLNDYFLKDFRGKRLHFMIKKPLIAVSNELEFGDKNSDSLRLDIGTFDGNQLGESRLSARTENPTAIAMWQKIAKRLKDMTVRGAIASNPKTGTTGPVKGHRFSKGAIRFGSSGGSMLRLTGLILSPTGAGEGGQ